MYAEDTARMAAIRYLNGETPTGICRDDHMPSKPTFYNWKDEGFGTDGIPWDELQATASKYTDLDVSLAGRTKKGCTYIMRAADYVKVGVTNDVASRVSGVQVGCPHPIEDVYFTQHVAYDLIEREMHKRLEQHNTSGEWFEYRFVDAIELLRDVRQECDEKIERAQAEMPPLKDLIKEYHQS